MLEVNAINIDGLPYEELELISELLSFEDSPMLLHFRDKLKNDWIAYWVDFDSSGYRWLYGKITKQELFEYLIGSRSLNKLFDQISSDYLFLIDKDSDDTIVGVKMLNSFAIPKKYFPNESSLYRYGLSDFYSTYLTEYNYIHKMREKSYIFKVEPSDLLHQRTVGAKEAAVVLNGVSNSVEGYIKVKAYNLLKDNFADVSKINKRVNKYKKRLSPRITETAYGSFEVWLAMDTITFDSDDQYDKQLRDSLIDDYKTDVLDVDYSSEEDARIISEKYSADERKMIYEPLIKLFENEDFSVSISDFTKSIGKNQNKISSSKAFKEIIIPPPTMAEVEADFSKKNTIISVVYNLREGEDITKISKKALLDNLIFAEEVAETPFEIQSPIESGGKAVLLNHSLRCTLKVDGAGNLQLYNSELELFASGNDIQNVTADIKAQFVALFEYYANHPDLADSKIEELKKYF